MPNDTAIDETLSLARDLCLGVGAFFVTAQGKVTFNLSDIMRPDDADSRVAALARSCLTHPAAKGNVLFWSAEADESDSAQSESLACVVVPIRSGAAWIGLLGVVDVWLPELDEEQRAGLLVLARILVEQGRTDRMSSALSPGAGKFPSGDGPTLAAPGHGSQSGSPLHFERGGERDAQFSEPFLGEVLDNLPDGLVVTRSDGTIVLVNQTFAAMTGLAMDAVLGEDAATILDASGAPPLEARNFEALKQGGAGSERRAWLEHLLAAPEPGRPVLVSDDDGEPIPLDAAGQRIESRFAGDCYVTLVRRTQRAAEGSPPEALLSQSTDIQSLLDHIKDGIVCCDASGSVVVANRAARTLQGLTDDELRVGMPFPSHTRLQSPEGRLIAREEHPLMRSMREDSSVIAGLVLQEHDSLIHVSISAHPLRVNEGEGAIAVLRDVTAERERQAHLTHYALHDPLTGLANRFLLIDSLRRMLDGLPRRGGLVSLIYLDLDHFKEINDTYGHDTGDQVLRAVARRLERAVRGEDVVGRLGGDEFAVAHSTDDQLSDGDAFVARLRKVLTAPYRFGPLVLDVGASIGWVSTPGSGDTPETLISQADRAMYDHKRQRRAAGPGAQA